MSALGSLVVSLALNHAEFAKGLDKSSQEALKFAKNAQGAVDRAERAITGSFKNIATSALGAVTAFVGVSSAINALNSSIDTLGKLDDMAQKTGSSVENLSKLQKVAVQFGQDFGAVDTALVKLSKGLAGIDDAGGKTAQALRAIGISQEFVKSKDPSEVFVQIAKNLQNYKDGAGKVALVTDLMGKSAADNLPYLNDLAENVDKYSGVSKESAAQAAKFQDNLGGLKVKTQELITPLGVDLVKSGNDLIAVLINSKTQSDLLFKDKTGLTWADNLGLSIARVVDVLGTLPAMLKAVSLSFQVVWNDVKTLNEVAKLGNPFEIYADVKGGKNVLSDFSKQLDARNKTLKEANEAYDKLWNDPKNTNEQAFLNRIKDRNRGRDASPYVSPNDGADINYVGADAEAAIKAEKEKAEKLAQTKREQAIKNAQILKDLQIDISQEQGETERKAADESKKKAMETARSKAENEIEQFSIFNTDRANKTAEHYKVVFAKEKELAEQRKAFWSSVEGTAHQVWTSVWQDGSNAFKNIGRTIKSAILDMLYQITLKKWIIGLSVGAASGTAGAANQSTASVGGMDLLGTIKSAFTDGNASVVQGIEKLGTFLSTGNGGLGDMLGGAIGQYSGAIANALPYAGAALSLIKGDIKGAILQGAGVAIGSMIGGPIGGAIGGALGSALGGLFGGHISRPKFYSNSTVTQDSINTYRSYGNSDASGTNVAKSATGGIAEQLQALATSLNTSLKEFTLGVTYSQKYNTYGISIGNEISKNGANRDAAFNAKSPEKQQNAIAQSFLVAVKKGFTELPQYLADIVANSTWNAKTESVANLGFLSQIKLVKESLATLPPVFDAINYSINKAKLSDAEAITARFNAVNTYTSLFYSQQEQFATYTDQLATQFGSLNLSLPDTRDGFRALVDGLKVVDDATAKQFDALIALAPAMDTYYQQLKDQTAAAQSLIDVNNFQDRASYETAQAFAGQGLRGIYNSSDASQNGTLLASELQKLRAGISELVKYAQNTASSTQETSRLLMSVSDGASLITTAG